MQQDMNGSNTNGGQSQNAFRAYSMLDYMQIALESDMAKFAEGGSLKSGYDNLDTYTSLYPGLYVIGGVSSLGKTTFIHQMADQIAKAGRKVIYFSLEQSTLELATKSLSRLMAMQDPSSAMSSLELRKGGTASIELVREQYSQYADNVIIPPCSFDTTIKTIETYVKNYIRQYQVKPVVVVDYLQAINQGDARRLSTKDVVDMHVRRLKQLQRNNDLVLIVISSLNRQNYLSQIDFESFKESGGIEYTADVVWGLQLEILHDELFDTQNKINEKREKVREAKAKNPRMVELVCLKNRFGISSYSCLFRYFPQYDWFVPDMANETASDDFMDCPDIFSPFR